MAVKKYTLIIIGGLLASCVGVATYMMAIDHNPQGEFNDTAHLIVLIMINSFVVFIPFLITFFSIKIWNKFRSQ